MIEIALLLLPLFGLIAVGYIGAQLKIADKKWISTLNLFSYHIAFPALIFKSLAFTPFSGSLLAIFGVQAVFATVMLLGVHWLGGWLKLGIENRNAYMLGLYFSMSGYVGIAALQTVYGAAAAAEGTAIVGAMIAVTLTLGIFILERSKKRKPSLKKIIKNIAYNPLIWSIAFGLAFGVFQIPLPKPAIDLVNTLANTASPAVLVGLGIFMAFNHPRRSTLRNAFVLSFLKVIVIPAGLFAIIWVLPNNDWLKTTLIQSVMPVAITSFALAEIYPINKSLISSSIVISTLLTAIGLPIAMWVTNVL